MTLNVIGPRRCAFHMIVAAPLALLSIVGSARGQNETAKILASDGAAGDYFGRGVAIEGDIAMVGAARDDHQAVPMIVDAGSVYIYQQNGLDPDLWDEIQIIRADFPDDGDGFGFAVAISGDVAVIGADGDDHSGFVDAGSAYVFRFDGTDWIQEAQLIASDPGAGDEFGCTVSVDGDLVVIGAARNDDACPLDPICNSGAVYVFRYDGVSWSEEAKITASDAAENDAFGIAVAVNSSTGDDVLIVGAFGDDDNGLPSSGSAYVYRYDGTDWNQDGAKLHASNPSSPAFFGASVAVEGNLAVVGAYFGFGNQSFSGSAYVFSYDGTDWNEDDLLAPSPGPHFLSLFGLTVDLSGTTIICGQPGSDENGDLDVGAAWVFNFNGTEWPEEARLTASDAAENDRFGQSVALSGDIAISGALLDDDNGIDSGSVYLFDPVCPCPWDLDDDGSVSATDLLGLLVTWGDCADCEDCPADFDANCTVGATDLLALLVNWGLCPCVEGTPPLSLAEELADACLSQADWDEFVDVMTDPESSEEDKDRYNCWMIHHLFHCDDCTCEHLPECPSPDPFN